MSSAEVRTAPAHLIRTQPSGKKSQFLFPLFSRTLHAKKSFPHSVRLIFFLLSSLTPYLSRAHSHSSSPTPFLPPPRHHPQRLPPQPPPPAPNFLSAPGILLAFAFHFLSSISSAASSTLTYYLLSLRHSPSFFEFSGSFLGRPAFTHLPPLPSLFPKPWAFRVAHDSGKTRIHHANSHAKSNFLPAFLGLDKHFHVSPAQSHSLSNCLHLFFFYSFCLSLLSFFVAKSP